MARITRMAARVEGSPMDNAARYGGKGSSLRVASVITASKPSVPVKKRGKSKPVLFLCVRPPTRTMAPSGNTTCRPST